MQNTKNFYKNNLLLKLVYPILNAACMTSPLTTYAGSVPANYDKYLGPFLFEPYAIDLVQRMRRRILW